MVGVVMFDDQAGILLGEPLQRARQLDVVLAVGGFIAIAQLRAGYSISTGGGACPRRATDRP